MCRKLDFNATTVILYPFLNLSFMSEGEVLKWCNSGKISSDFLSCHDDTKFECFHKRWYIASFQYCLCNIRMCYLHLHNFWNVTKKITNWFFFFFIQFFINRRLKCIELKVSNTFCVDWNFYAFSIASITNFFLAYNSFL